MATSVPLPAPKCLSFCSLSQWHLTSPDITYWHVTCFGWHKLVSCVLLFQCPLPCPNGITSISTNPCDNPSNVPEFPSSLVNIRKWHNHIVSYICRLESFDRCFQHLVCLFAEILLAYLTNCNDPTRVIYCKPDWSNSFLEIVLGYGRVNTVNIVKGWVEGLVVTTLLCFNEGGG